MIKKFTQQIIDAAKRNEIDPVLLGAIVLKESSGNPFACRFEPSWKLYKDPIHYAKINNISIETEKFNQAQSFGLCQVMGCVMRERGFEGPWGMAFDVIINLDIGAKHLKSFLVKHNNELDAIAAYNAGTPRKTERTSKPGTFIYSNQSYVDGVLKNMEILKDTLKGLQ